MNLPLSNSDQCAIVDDDLFDHLNQWKWRLIPVSNGAVYVGRKTHLKGKGITIYLHREVMGHPKGMMVDHRDGNIFDNRRENLRLSTNSQNQQNSKGKKHSSIYKNVYWNKKLKKWKAQIRVDGQDFHLGYFDNERHAAYAVDLNLPFLHGEYARLNVSDFQVGYFLHE